MSVKGAVDRLSTLVNRWGSHRRELCADIKLFSTLTEREQRHIAPALHHRSYLEGEVIFDEGERGQAVYFVLGGTVTIRHELGDGRRVQLQFEKGDLFGVTALLLDEPRAAQALARTNCQLAIFFRSDLQRLLETRAPSASKISLELARHLARLLLKVALDADRLTGV